MFPERRLFHEGGPMLGKASCAQVAVSLDSYSAGLKVPTQKGAPVDSAGPRQGHRAYRRRPNSRPHRLGLN